MLNTSYSVGAGAYALVLTKQFDTDTKSCYSVAGLSASVARKMSVQHQTTKNNTNRHLVDSTSVDLVPGTTSGSTYEDRIYTVIQRSPYTSAADIKGKLATHLALMGTAGFQDAVLNKEL
jgi:galactitol-specific phosphotransferase system IIB component